MTAPARIPEPTVEELLEALEHHFGKTLRTASSTERDLAIKLCEELTLAPAAALAEHFHCSASTVKRSLARARERLSAAGSWDGSAACIAAVDQGPTANLSEAQLFVVAYRLAVRSLKEPFQLDALARQDMDDLGPRVTEDLGGSHHSEAALANA